MSDDVTQIDFDQLEGAFEDEAYNFPSCSTDELSPHSNDSLEKEKFELLQNAIQDTDYQCIMHQSQEMSFLPYQENNFPQFIPVNSFQPNMVKFPMNDMSNNQLKPQFNGFINVSPIPMFQNPNFMPQFNPNINMIDPRFNFKNIYEVKKPNLPHIKKPLNAFMLYMRDVRADVLKLVPHKDSTTINQMIGKMWQNLSKQQQAQYFEKAKYEREKHKIMYPEYNPRDYYAQNLKKKRRKRDKNGQGT